MLNIGDPVVLIKNKWIPSYIDKDKLIVQQKDGRHVLISNSLKGSGWWVDAIYVEKKNTNLLKLKENYV